MTTGQIQASGDGTVRLRLGRVPVHLPEPVASIALAVAGQPQGPRHHRGRGSHHPGCSPEASPDGRSAPRSSPSGSTQLGIRPGQDRSTALFQLAAEIPAAILARTLAISTSAAVTWQRHAAGDWITYAADVSRRPPQQPVPSRHETREPT